VREEWRAQLRQLVGKPWKPASEQSVEAYVRVGTVGGVSTRRENKERETRSKIERAESMTMSQYRKCRNRSTSRGGRRHDFPTCGAAKTDVKFSFPESVPSSGTMRTTLQRGVRTLSWTRVVPRVHRQTRCVQIRATSSEEPANGANLPLANTPSSVESRGISHS